MCEQEIREPLQNLEEKKSAKEKRKMKWRARTPCRHSGYHKSMRTKKESRDILKAFWKLTEHEIILSRKTYLEKKADAKWQALMNTCKTHEALMNTSTHELLQDT